MATHQNSTLVSRSYYERATPALPHVIPIPQPLPAAEISQQELVELIEARNVLAQLEKNVASLESVLKARLESGASVQSGVHVAELKENFRRSVAWRDVTLRLAAKIYGPKRGEAYCENVLQNTKPTRTVSLTVS